MDADARIEALEDALARKDEEIARLEAALGLDFLAPMEWRLTGQETRVFGCLLARDVATKHALMAACYTNLGKEEPDPKIVDVFVCKVRKKLAVFDVSIETVWGVGYRLSAATRATVKAIMEGEGAWAA